MPINNNSEQSEQPPDVGLGGGDKDLIKPKEFQTKEEFEAWYKAEMEGIAKKLNDLVNE